MLRRAFVYAVAALLFLFGMRLATLSQAREARTSAAPLAKTVPAYHPAYPKPQFAPTLPASDFPKNAVAQHAYATAAKIEPLLNQLPCLCDCQGKHSTLLDCYEDRQAAHCIACQRETYFAWQESRDGQSASEIRKEILRGAWKNTTLSTWKRPLIVKIATVR
jgi:hypothetical protein